MIINIIIQYDSDCLIEINNELDNALEIILEKYI